MRVHPDLLMQSMRMARALEAFSAQHLHQPACHHPAHPPGLLSELPLCAAAGRMPSRLQTLRSHSATITFQPTSRCAAISRQRSRHRQQLSSRQTAAPQRPMASSRQRLMGASSSRRMAEQQSLASSPRRPACCWMSQVGSHSLLLRRGWCDVSLLASPGHEADSSLLVCCCAATSALFPGAPQFPTSAPACPPFRAGLRVWHKLDSSFRQPRAAAYLRLSSAAGYASPRAAAARCGVDFPCRGVLATRAG